MTAPLRFTKMHGLGNDYVYIDLFRERRDLDWPAIARSVSDRHRGVGADGLILIGPSERADARMRMFNADGSEGEMCGNGVRCVAKYVGDHGYVPADQARIETGRGVLLLGLTRDHGKVEQVTVDMAPPILASAEIPTTLPGDPPVDVAIEVRGRSYPVTAVSMGNPHAVLFVDDVDSWPLVELGPEFEHHSAFPRRVNFHIVQVIDRNEVRMRTWERGSGITQACGTGACAVCVAGVLTGRTDSDLLAHLPGGDLTLRWNGGDASVFMTGPATEVFSGEWPLDVESAR